MKKKILTAIVNKVGNELLRAYDEMYNTPAREYLYAGIIFINNVTVLYDLDVTVD